MTTSRVHVVTGATQGIGRAIALALAKRGETVVVTYKTGKARVENLRADVEKRGATLHAEQLDVTDEAAVDAFFKSVVKQFGRLDVLVTNAGLTEDNLLAMMPTDSWRRVLETNLTGVFFCCRAASRAMIAQKSGRIINISSMSAIAPLAGQSNYAAAKAGVVALTKTLAKELAPFNILVNAVAPGFVETPLTDAMKPEKRAEYLKDVPLGRFARPEEVAAVVEFFASPAANYITGSVIQVNGGIL
jgi:3-oxoacyl-[acyl-carrier protein] reductase